MTGNCILVFGVSGVGKTTVCRRYVSKFPETIFTSASSLLKSAKQSTSEELRTSSPDGIVDNQSALAGALQAYRKGREAKPILIDAHGVIDNDQTLVRIPSSAIHSMTPNRLILLEASAAVVAERRAKDSRSRPARDLKFIEREIRAERDAVEGFALDLGLRLDIAELHDAFDLEEILGG